MIPKSGDFSYIRLPPIFPPEDASPLLSVGFTCLGPIMALLRSRTARTATCLAIVAWCALFVVTHLPRTPQVTEFRGLDKAFHFAAFAGLAFLCCWAVSSRRRLTFAAYGWIVGVLAIYAAADELLQIPLPRRNADPLDWLADTAGAACGVAVFALFVRWTAGRRKPADATTAPLGHAEKSPAP